VPRLVLAHHATSQLLGFRFARLPSLRSIAGKHGYQELSG
jgi:hypothetical protein